MIAATTNNDKGCRRCVIRSNHLEDNEVVDSVEDFVILAIVLLFDLPDVMYVCPFPSSSYVSVLLNVM